MAEFKISRFRYTWKGVWVTATAYIKDDVVKFGGSSWVCVRGHTSSAFATNQLYIPDGATDIAPAWTKMSDGFVWREEWLANTPLLYNPGDIVKYGATLWLCVTSHTSQSVFDTDIIKWTTYAESYNFKTDWTASTRYAIGDIVKYGGQIYKCLIGHTSSSTTNGLEVELNLSDSTLTKWELIVDGERFQGPWATAQRYIVGDLVNYGGVIWKCKQGHTSGDDSTINFDSDEHWELEIAGSKFGGEWNNTTTYQIGQVVRAGGSVYYSLTVNYNSPPDASFYQLEDKTDPVDWALIAKGVNLVGEYSSIEKYKVGDVVRRGANLYVSLRDTTPLGYKGSWQPSTEYFIGNIVVYNGVNYRCIFGHTSDTVYATNAGSWEIYSGSDGSTLDYLDISNWELIVPSKRWRNSWTVDVTYSFNDVVLFKGTSYACNIEHTSTTANFPGDNGEGFVFWDVVLLGNYDIGMQNQGDLLTYGLSRSVVNDGSTFGPTEVTIGEEDKILRINDADQPYYSTWGNTSYLVNVAPNGVDDEFDSERGFNYFKPWKTIRFACDRVEALGLNVENTVKVRVWPGVYEEILPIVVPANVAIQGDEVRSITVKPNAPIVELATDSSYTIAALSRISAIMDDLLQGNAIVKTIGNIEDPVPVLVDEVEITSNVSSDIETLISNIQNYINFYVNSTGSDTAVIGSNDAVADPNDNYANALLILEANKDFLASEAVAYIEQTFPAYDFIGDLCKRDIRRYIDAWKYDIIYTGNYKSVLAARYYKNAVLGSAGEDMFYVRNSTGIRNMTLSGLTGTLNPLGVFDYYQRPTGGAYVSLDPGWGPDDERVWITTRSCYVQNCTTFGFAAIGQKIDGALHNGGNRSIVSNDFTQLISDGIGAWVLNNGRAELVSVFTYYSQVGYLAEDGGIIRATNGNNSYGTFGAVAIGVDNSEIPFTGTVNNRNNDAQIAAAFAGEINDEILILEFDHAGQNYTSASYSFVGAGSGAVVVQDEFRDDAVFEVRLTNARDSSGIIGGRGYTSFENNAQTGNLTTIQLSTQDANEPADYIGKRIIIVSGTGTGQYGYISAYDDATKTVSVYKESTGAAGWDHVISGTPIVNPLLPDTRYRIEPRLTFSAPAYSAEAISVGVDTWSSIVYGETTEVYANVVGDAGTGTVETQDGLAAITARWTVSKVGRTYSLTLTNAGAGYAVNDDIVIEGTQVGGASPENDITILVTEVTEDSTNSIVSYTYSGIGTSGKFIATPTTGTSFKYSNDGSTWSSGSFPTAGNWNVLASGANKFIAIKSGSTSAMSSDNGVAWTNRTIGTVARNWNSAVYGTDRFVAVSSTANVAAYSTNGTTWTETSMSAGDSSFNAWVDVCYGKNKFVAVANTGNALSYSTDGITWTAETIDSIVDGKDWVSIAYGNNRFVAMSSQGDIAYSFDLATWYDASMPARSEAAGWIKIRYAQGVFFAIRGSSWATSPDGIVWTARTPATSQVWGNLAFGNPDVTLEDSTLGNSKPIWMITGSAESTIFDKVITGATARARAIVQSGEITSVRIWEPGSAYTEQPTLTIFDPNEFIETFTENRIGDGVLGNPSWVNRGIGYRTSTTTITVTGNGFADIIPVGKFITLSNLERQPPLGGQLLINNNTTIYTIVTVRELDPIDGITAYLQISPTLTELDDVQHGTVVSIREKFSQCRITGHDFLDIGTGNFVETNYPVLYSTGLVDAQPFNEVVEEAGGRVFYTSTDQSGNFRTGELFAVEQATGIVTISADFFDLAGLSELRLGGVRLGGTGVVIREFSTDPFFYEDSNNIVPTQRAIKTYLANRLSIGGADFVTGAVTAGQIKVGPIGFTNVLGLKIRIQSPMNFVGPRAGVTGYMLAQALFYKSFTQD